MGDGRVDLSRAGAKVRAVESITDDDGLCGRRLNIETVCRQCHISPWITYTSNVQHTPSSTKTGKRRTLPVCNEESVNFNIPAMVNVVSRVSIRCRWLRECLREVLLALTLVVNGLDEPADDGRLSSWRALLKISDFVADDPLP